MNDRRSKFLYFYIGERMKTKVMKRGAFAAAGCMALLSARIAMADSGMDDAGAQSIRPDGAAAPAHGGEAQQLDPVVVTGVAPDAPLTIVVHPRAPRQPVPASDGADFLKSIPGFDTIRKGGSNGDPVLRGMVGSRINILVDGGAIAGGCAYRMDPPTAYIAPELFDRVVIIKGPETVLYGPGNSAGTVLFERDNMRRTQTGMSVNGSLLGGSWGRADENIDASGGTPDVYASLVANHTRSGDYKDGHGDRVHSSYERWNTDASVGWTPDDDTRVALSAGKGNGQAAYAFSSMDGAQFLRESLGLDLEKQHITTVFTKLEAKLYYNYADHVMDNYTLRNPDPNSMMPMAMASDVDRRTTGGRVAGTFEWQPFKLIAGVDATQNVHSSRNGGPPGSMMGYYRDMPRVRDARISNAGLFAEGTWTFAERERLVSGARIDWAHARGYTLTSGDGGGMTSMDMSMGDASDTVSVSRSKTLASGFARWERDLEASPATLYAGIGHVERFPDYWELFGGNVTSSLPAFQSLRSERTTQLDVGLHYGAGNLKAWASLYAGHVSDFILIHYAASTMDTSYASNVDATTAGGEAGVEYAIGGWKLDASLAYAWGRDDTEHRPLPQLPPLETRLGLTYDAGDWSIGMLLRAATAQHRIAIGEGNIVGKDLGSTGGFGVFSLNGGYRLTKNLVLTAGIDNVFNKIYAEHVNAVNEGLTGYVNTIRVDEPGRTAWVKAGVKF